MNIQRRKPEGRFSPPFPFKKVLSGRAGSTYFELMIKFIVVITLMATVLSFLSIFTVYLNLNHMCGRIVRVIEMEGQVSDNVHDVFYRLKEQTGLSPIMTIEDVTYCDGQQRIQLRDTFTVKLKYNHFFTVFRPSSSPPIQIAIPMEVRITGMSERFWKLSE
ncbi:DUF4320 family protein [Dehalobacterium formicoaceticum]|uniref:DUF4320 family protein n=1 Tax=Dehalobacterium formicoaceticum TaxID=51515 RepID=UPI0031F6094D